MNGDVAYMIQIVTKDVSRNRDIVLGLVLLEFLLKLFKLLLAETLSLLFNTVDLVLSLLGGMSS